MDLSSKNAKNRSKEHSPLMVTMIMIVIMVVIMIKITMIITMIKIMITFGRHSGQSNEVLDQVSAAQVLRVAGPPECLVLLGLTWQALVLVFLAGLLVIFYRRRPQQRVRLRAASPSIPSGLFS